MAIPPGLVLLPVGLLFLLSGLIVNALQALLYVLIRPCSRNLYRRINFVLFEMLLLQLVWLFDWWAGIKIQLHADSETFENFCKEHSLLLSNHRSDIDWLLGYVLAERRGCLGSSLGVLKKSLRVLPVIGWSMWFSEYLFLERNWQKDEQILKSGLQRLQDFPRPILLAFFVEGTRFTPAKLRDAQEYAISQGLPVPNNVLIPRTKGFVSTVTAMRSFVPAIYDFTVVVPKDQPAPTMLTMLAKQSSVIHIRAKRYAMSDMPESKEEISQWCRDLFVAKDALLEKYNAQGTFDEEIRPLGRPVNSLLAVIFWVVLLSFGAYEFFKWSRLLTSWQGILIFVVILAIVAIVMQSMISFTQSENSRSARAAQHRVNAAVDDQPHPVVSSKSPLLLV